MTEKFNYPFSGNLYFKSWQAGIVCVLVTCLCIFLDPVVIDADSEQAHTLGATLKNENSPVCYGNKRMQQVL